MAKKATLHPREMDRTKLPVSVRHDLLMEAGYKCGNPACRNILTLDVHHILYVSEGGGNQPSNLLVLCPYCHSMHHAGNIPVEAIRLWKGLLLALNQSFDRHSRELLLFLQQTRGQEIWYSGDGLLQFAGLISAGLVKFKTEKRYAYTQATNTKWAGMDVCHSPIPHSPTIVIHVELTEKGALFVEAWMQGDEARFRELVSKAPTDNPA
jgi:hypothetical protein